MNTTLTPEPRWLDLVTQMITSIWLDLGSNPGLKSPDLNYWVDVSSQSETVLWTRAISSRQVDLDSCLELKPKFTYKVDVGSLYL